MKRATLTGSPETSNCTDSRASLIATVTRRLTAIRSSSFVISSRGAPDRLPALLEVAVMDGFWANPGNGAT